MAKRRVRVWDREGQASGTSFFGSGLGAAGAIKLLGGALASSTRAIYQRHWESFRHFCGRAALGPLPATDRTVCRNLVHFFESGTVGGQSIRPYSAAIAAHRRRHSLPDSTESPLVAVVKAIYRSLDSQRDGKGPPERSAPIPAAFALACLTEALDSAPQLLVNLGVIALGFQLGCRPGSLLNLQRADIRILPTCGQIQIKTFKGSQAGMVNLMTIRLPWVGSSDRMSQLLRLLVRLGPSYVFVSRSHL